MRKFLGAAAGAALVVLGVGPGASVAATPPAGTNLQVLSWNMCDVVRWGGCAERQTDAKVALLKQQVQQRYVQAMLLQEVCQSTLRKLTAELGPAWSVSFQPYHWSQKGVITTVSPCETKPGTSEPLDPNDDVGTAIVVKAGLSAPLKYPMVQPSTALVPPFHCATADYFEVRLCAVHSPRELSEEDPDYPGLDYRDDYQLAVSDIVEDSPKVVFGGDFNTLPPDAGAKYARVWKPADLYSAYKECDQKNFPGRTGTATHSSNTKLDYLFSNLKPRSCFVEPTAPEGQKNLSDHRFLIYSVEVAPSA
ncbi:MULTISPECIES: endonuclease/exonuclease/phosphatase family protein [unclassified Streptomyces]|uniref:endonuclease/exonuclease/phosphatase family protein n=1 Tax=unclassified Streptomyces TaxID=2593676 RepID=UPI00331E45D2